MQVESMKVKYLNDRLKKDKIPMAFTEGLLKQSVWRSQD